MNTTALILQICSNSTENFTAAGEELEGALTDTHKIHKLLSAPLKFDYKAIFIPKNTTAINLSATLPGF